MVRFSRVGLAVCLMGHPLWRWPLAWMSHREGNILKDQAYGERMGVSPRNSMECGNSCRPSNAELFAVDCEGNNRYGRQSLNNASDITLKTSCIFVTASTVLLCNFRDVNAAFQA